MKLIKNILFNILFFIYNILIFFIFLILVVFIIFKNTKSFTLKNLKNRFIFKTPKLKYNQAILFHSSSLGEFNALKPLLKKIKSFNNEVVITTFTETALNNAINYGNAFLMPFDFYFITLSFFKKIKPKYIFIAETEIWPNFIIIGSRFAKIYWINARMSEKSFRYYKFFSYFIKKIFENVEKIFVQDLESFERFKRFVPIYKLKLCGNTKYDSLEEINIGEDYSEILKKINFDNKKIITFGSIHPDEFETIIKSFILIKNESNDIRYIIVPRHIEKIKFFEDISNRYKIRYSLFEDILKEEDPFKQLLETEILLINKTGILLSFYKISTICFVGGSLNNIGGHNILEPAIFKKPVLFGPNYQNQKEAAKKLLENRGGFVVSDEYDIKARIKILIENKEKLNEISDNSYKTLQLLQGATERIVKELSKSIPNLSRAGSSSG